jgi:stage V sporulation protein G
MKITEVRVYPEDHDELKGYASITLDDCLMIREFKIIRSGSGDLHIAMPNREQQDGSYRVIAYPNDIETRRMIEEAILTAYRKAT